MFLSHIMKKGLKLYRDDAFDFGHVKMLFDLWMPVWSLYGILMWRYQLGR